MVGGGKKCQKKNQKAQFEVSGLGLEFQVSSLGIFDEILVSKF